MEPPGPTPLRWIPARSSLPRLLPQIELPRFPDQCLSELIVLFRGDEFESGAHRRCGQAAWEHTSLREHYPIPMPRAKKPPQLSAKERALLNRLDRLSEEEIKRLTTREIFAYFKLIDRVDSRTDIRRMVERAKWRHK